MTIRTKRVVGCPETLTAWAVLLGGVLVGSATTTTAMAQADGPTASVRLDQLLSSDRVLSESVDGPVWDVAATPGRRLVQLPMQITPNGSGEPGVAESIEEPAFDFAGGRFLFWVLPEGQGEARSRGRAAAESTGPSDAELMDLTALLTRRDPLDMRAAGRTPPPDTMALPEVSAEAPRLARELRVSRDARGQARVAWEVTRGIPGGTVKTGSATQPYALLLDRDQLDALEPERPDRLSRNANESSREFTFRKRQADADFREIATAFRDLQRDVRSLPERFEQDLPDTVWAVFEVNALGAGWTLRGHEAGPWSMGFDQWELLTALASRRGGRSSTGDGVFSADELSGIRRLAQLAGDPHPWTQNLLSTALSQSDLPGRASPGDPAALLIAVVLQSPETLARNRMVYALSQLEPATPAAAQLLAAAAQRTGDPAIQLAALQVQLGVQLVDTNGRGGGAAAGEGVAGAISVTNAMLADEQGPDAGLVIEQLLAAIPDTPETDNAVVGGVRFDNLSAPRFDAAVGAVLRSAGERPAVVGGWLNRQLLGSGNAEVVNRTLDLMSRADAPAPVIGPLAKGLRRLVFGATQVSESAPPSSTLMLTSGLPLDSANHALFRLLNSGDPALRKKGWQVLRHFELTDQPQAGSRRRGTPVVDDTASDPLKMIVDAGLSQPESTPSSLVPFLERQPDTARADGPLVRVVVEGDPVASRRAARVLRGSERQFGPALGEMEADAREAFANRVYAALGDAPEPVSGLMRTEASGGRNAGGVISWFAQELAAGNLPEAAAWAEAAGGERPLMQAAVSTDEQLAAGAFAALTALAGGDRELQHKMFSRFKDDRTSKTSESMAEAWVDARKDIYTQRLKSAAGEYRLVMMVTGLAPAEGGPGKASDPILGNDPSAAAVRAEGSAAVEKTVRTTLGVLRLIADGRALTFSSGTPELGVPDDRLAIRITTPSQLKAFDAAEVKALPLEEIEQPLDLLPEPEGRWRGKMMLPDGRDLELLMEPWGGVGKSADDKKTDDAPSGPKADDKKKSPPQGGGDLKNNPFGN